MRLSNWVRKQQFNNEHGGTLVMVLMVLVVLTVLGTSLLAITINNTKLTTVDREDQSAYYIAEAGSVYGLNKFEKIVNEVYDESANEIEFFSSLDHRLNNEVNNLTNENLNRPLEESNGKAPRFTVALEGNNGSYFLRSTGEIGKRSRTVERPVTVKWQSKGGLGLPEDVALHSRGSITLSGGANIVGNVATNSILPNSITINGGAVILGDFLLVPEEAHQNVFKIPNDYEYHVPEINTLPPKIYTMPSTPDYPNYPIHQNVQVKKNEYEKYDLISNGDLRIDNYVVDGYTLHLLEDTSFNEIKFGEENTLTINVGNSDKEIVVDHLNMSNGHLKIEGTGNLTIYVNNMITFGSGSTINDTGSIEALTIYYRGVNDVYISGSQKVFGTLFVDNADVTITAGGSFAGNIISGGENLKVGGGAYNPSLIYAPNTDIALSGGGTIKGVVIANQLIASGGTNIQYDDLDLSYLQFFSSSENSDSLINTGSVIEIEE